MVCLYFGSFNPFHKTHLGLVQYALAQLPCCEVWLILSPQNPQKDSREQLPYELRKQLILDAIQEDPRIKLIEIEATLPRPLYSIKTVQALKLLYPTRSFGLLIGSDNLLSFTTWHRWQELYKLVHLYVYPRPDYPLDQADPRIEYTACLDAPETTLSATIIRHILKEGGDASHLLASPSSWSKLVAYWRLSHQG